MNNTTLIRRADAYKYSHKKFWPKGIRNNFSYAEARKVSNDAPFPKDTPVLFFGLQMFVKKYMSTAITKEEVDYVESVVKAACGNFNREDWDIIVNEYNGFLPLQITGLPEGTVTTTGVMLANVVATDIRFAWLASFIETALLRAIWYPTTVASLSRHIKVTLKKYLQLTADDVETELAFKLNDFGARGASSSETAEIGGLAHLVNFMGTDTIEALFPAIEYYNAEGPVGNSISATEHSTITAWGKLSELSAFENVIDQCAGEPIYACVSDSYDYYNAVDNLWPRLKNKIVENNSILVIRPDSGNPLELIPYSLESLSKSFGYTTNSKGYKVLKNVRIIWGDGVNAQMIENVLNIIAKNGFSTANVAFGMGGALLQSVTRDDFGFAQKTAAIYINIGKSTYWRHVYKDPITDPGKKSKKGLLKNTLLSTGYVTEQTASLSRDKSMDIYYDHKDGKYLPSIINKNFSEIRKLAEVA